MRSLDILAAVLLVVGGLNWGLVGVANFDLVASLTGNAFGQTSFFSSFVYLLVGMAACYQALSLRSIQQRWGVAKA